MSMGDLEALFGDLGDFKEDIKVYGTMAVGAVGAKVLATWGMQELNGAVGSYLGGYSALVLNAAEVAAGVAAARYLPRALGQLGPSGSYLTQGIVIGLVADGLVGFVKAAQSKFFPTTGAGFFSKLPAPALEDWHGLSRLAAAPTTVEQVNGLGAAPVQVEQVQGFGSMAASLY